MPESITCPDCGSVSFNPNDVEQGYCGRCHWWTSDPTLGAVRPETDLNHADAHATGRRLADIMNSGILRQEFDAANDDPELTI